MKFGFDDREYEYDGKLHVEEAMQLFENSKGLGINEIDEALAKGNPYAVAAWMFLLKRRAGEAVRWTDMLKLDIRLYKGVLPEEIPAPSSESEGDGDVSPEKKPDPTGSGSGKTQKRGTTST